MNKTSHPEWAEMMERSQMVATREAIAKCDLCATMGYPDSGVHGYGMIHSTGNDRMEICKAQMIYQDAGIARYTD